ncbi:MAG: hypothetical protein PHH09_05805, partial [Methanoregulaceae archaeon]|nr:hypothetical protein [Methanoregulaceae archaeon]
SCHKGRETENRYDSGNSQDSQYPFQRTTSSVKEWEGVPVYKHVAECRPPGYATISSPGQNEQYWLFATWCKED